MTWHPIESAPKSGAQIIVSRRLMEPPYVSMSVATWVPAEGVWLANLTQFEPEDFEDIWTHWHTLPSPPEVSR